MTHRYTSGWIFMEFTESDGDPEHDSTPSPCTLFPKHLLGYITTKFGQCFFFK